MKRITAILIASAAFIGCSYVGGVDAITLPDCDAIASSYFDKHMGSEYASIREYIVDQDAEVCGMGATLKKSGATEAEAAKFLGEVRAAGLAKATTKKESDEITKVIERKNLMFMAGYEGYVE